MSSRPRHCLSFSFCSRSHISGSSWARLSWPVHEQSSSTAWVLAWDCWPRTLRRIGIRWHNGCRQRRSCKVGRCDAKERTQRKKMDQSDRRLDLQRYVTINSLTNSGSLHGWHMHSKHFFFYTTFYNLTYLYLHQGFCCINTEIVQTSSSVPHTL